MSSLLLCFFAAFNLGGQGVQQGISGIVVLQAKLGNVGNKLLSQDHKICNAWQCGDPRPVASLPIETNLYKSRWKRQKAEMPQIAMPEKSAKVPKVVGMEAESYA